MDTLTQSLLFVVAVGAGALLVRSLVRDVRGRAALKAAFASLGFKPCPEEIPSLQQTVRTLHDSSNIEIRHAEMLATRGGPVYRYEVRSADPDAAAASEEFLFPMNRKSERPLVLFMPPAGIEEGTARKLLEKLTTLASPGALDSLAVPRDLRGSILSALGPAGTDLYDLIDDRQLTDLRHAGRLGFFVARAAGQQCALEIISHYGRRAWPAFDLPSAARFVRELAERNARGQAAAVEGAETSGSSSAARLRHDP